MNRASKSDIEGTQSGSGLDLLAVEAYTWTPGLETTCEICLREAAAGRRVGFVFLDIENVDHFRRFMSLRFSSVIYAVGRKSRLARVRAIEEILRSGGVEIIAPVRASPSTGRLSCAEAGVGSLQALREFRLEGAALGVGTVSTLLTKLADSNPDFTENRAMIDRILNSAYQAYLLTGRLIEDYRPANVLVLNGRFAVSKAVAEAARLADVGVRYHEIVSTHDRFYYSPYPVHSALDTRQELLDSWASAGEGRELIAARYFAPGRGGMRLFENTFLDQQSRDQVIPRSGRWRIVYFVSSIDELAAVDGGFANPLFETQQSAAEWLVSWVRSRPDTELFIRMHPRSRRLSARERGWWSSLAGDNVNVVHAESQVHSYELASTADRVVTHHSSIGAEAAYAGKVSILVGDADYRGLDCVYEPATTAELEQMLLDPELQPKPPENCLPYGYQRLMRGVEYRFYQPASFSEGSFFGRRITPYEEEPLFRRKVTGALVRLSSALGSSSPTGGRKRRR